MKFYSFSLLYLLIFFLSSCGNKSGEEQIIVLGGASIPVMKTEKARKAKLSFDLIEIIRKKDNLDAIVLITNKSDDAEVKYLREEMAITDNNGYIYKAQKTNVEGIDQLRKKEFVPIPKNGKIKTILSFDNIRDDASDGTLFFKGKLNRKKEHNFTIKFKKVPLVNN